MSVYAVEMYTLAFFCNILTIQNVFEMHFKHKSVYTPLEPKHHVPSTGAIHLLAMFTLLETSTP